MSINKREFDAAIFNAVKHPRSVKAKNEAGRMLDQLGNMIVFQYKLKYNKDCIQSAVMRSWEKIAKADKSKGSPFNYFWTCMYRDLIKEYKKQQRYESRTFVFSQLKYEPDPRDRTGDAYDSVEMDADEMIRRLYEVDRCNKSELEMLEMGAEKMLKKIDIDLDAIVEEKPKKVEIPPDLIAKKKNKKKETTALLYKNGKKVPQYICDSLDYVSEKKKATLDELVGLFGHGRGHGRDNREISMEIGLIKAIKDNGLGVSIFKKEGKTILLKTNSSMETIEVDVE